METAILHYEAFKRFLSSHLAREQANGSRTNARDKLTRLTKNQFQELSTDVYDELTRRIRDSNEAPFLPVRDEFHPKRNQARQKLATLPKSRFKDLASDVYYELERRFPDLKDMDFSQQRTENQQPPPPPPPPQQSYQQQSSQPTYQQSPPPQMNNKNPIQQQKNQNQSDFASSQAPNKNNIVPEISTLKQEVVDFTIQKPNSKDAEGLPQEYMSPISPTSHTPTSHTSTSRTQSSASSVSDFGSRYINSVSSASSRGDQKNRDTANSLKNKNPSIDTLIADIGGMIEPPLTSAYNNLKKSNSGPTTDSERVIDLQQQLDEQERVNRQQSTKISQLENDYYKLNEEHLLQQEVSTSSFYKEAPKVDVVNDHGIKPTPDGVIDESKIASYQAAIDNLLRAGRSEDPANVLLAMKSIVISCKDITEEVELYEKHKGSSIKAENQEKLTQLKTKLSATLTNLMAAAKNHATGAGLSPVSLLDAAASHLTVAVVEVAKHLKLKQSLNDGIHQNHQDQNTGKDKKINSIVNGRSRGIDTEDLKDFLERQTEAIVQAIQTLLASIRNGSYGGEIIEKINTVITILLNVIAVCNDSFEENTGTPYRKRGSVLLKDLERCIDKMEEMKTLIEKDNEIVSDKGSKQRLAGVAFEIAKFTKELYGLVENDKK
ncbi:3840_t:CDS:2 [Entrophospora sp. SA101]|nr:3840_t:CDS:2 [Entrophospora sp. SA101]